MVSIINKMIDGKCCYLRNIALEERLDGTIVCMKLSG